MPFGRPSEEVHGYPVKILCDDISEAVDDPSQVKVGTTPENVYFGPKHHTKRRPNPGMSAPIYSMEKKGIFWGDVLGCKEAVVTDYVLAVRSGVYVVLDVWSLCWPRE
jgi:hypothetical protein